MTQRKSDFLTIPDLDTERKNDVTLVYNSKGREKETEVMLKIGETITTLSKQDLYTVLFVAASKEWQDFMLPNEVLESSTFTKLVTVTVNNDMKAGEDIKIKIPFTFTDAQLKDWYEKMYLNKEVTTSDKPE